MVEKKVTLEELAEMISRGFEATATKVELQGVRDEVQSARDEAQSFREHVENEFQSVRSELGMFRNETVSELKEIKTVLGPLVRIVAGLEIDLRDVRSRVTRLEQKAGITK